jgi:hypothetical protein
MIVEGLGKLTFVNGLLRVQALKINTDGEFSESGTIEIPGNKVADIINALATGTQGISDKLGEVDTVKSEDNKSEEKSSGKKGKKKKS